MKKKILVVEKNKYILDVIEIALSVEGYDLLLAQSEDDILDKILDFHPDAILLDIVFPTVEGTELCRKIKARKETKNIPVIVLSTHKKINRVKDICADEVIEKPFDVSFLLDTIKSQLKYSVN